MKKILIPVALGAAAMLSACGVTDPVSLGGGQYSISSSNAWAWDGAGQQANAIEAANKFCGEKGKTARITSMTASDAVAYQSVATGQVTFVCEDPDGSGEDPVELADGVYMLAGSASGYQGIKARYGLVKKAAEFCARGGLKAQMVDATRESGTNFTSATGRAGTANNAESALQNTSADILFRCVKQ